MKFNLRIGLSYIIVFGSALAYAFVTGPVVFMGDTYLFAERAKHIAFEGSFDLDGGFYIYPPLYSVFMSIGYLFKDPEITHRIILLTNVFLYSLIFFPIRSILKDYSQVSNKYLNSFSIVLSLSPYLLPYVSMFLSEALYLPVLLSFTYFLLISFEKRNLSSYLYSGFFLGLSLLIRTASNTLVIAYIIIAAIDILVDSFRGRKLNLALLSRYSAGLAVLIFVFGSWKVYEHFFVDYKYGVGSYFDPSVITKIFTDNADFDHHAHWLFNCIKYYLTASLVGTTIFSVIIVFLRPTLLMRDLFFLFSFFVAIGSSLSIILLTSAFWGGTDLTWNRYLAPYVIFFVFIALRYIHLIATNSFKSFLLVCFFMFLTNAPYSLGCHFPDSLILFMGSFAGWEFIPFLKPLFSIKLVSLVSNAVFYLLMIIPVFFYVYSKKAIFSKKFGICVILIVYFFANCASLGYWSVSNYLSIGSHNGISKTLYSINKEGDVHTYIDPKLKKTFFDYYFTLFYFPYYINESSYADIDINQTNRFYYVSEEDFADKLPIYKDKFGFKLYDFNLNQHSQKNVIRFEFIEGIFTTETIHSNGTDYFARYLGTLSKATLTKLGKKPVTVKLKISISTANRTRDLQLKVNGKPVDLRKKVSSVFRVDGYQDLVWNISLYQEVNEIEFLSFSEPTKLADGRNVCFLLIGNPVITVEQ
ncbi:hypothetical protein [Leptospira sp. 'Mane']|uniref:hypothetical protein n=1 Tax=Leptospira sp. 'Mane' TaxID=3387407 RepID=UPI00398A67E9